MTSRKSIHHHIGFCPFAAANRQENRELHGQKNSLFSEGMASYGNKYISESPGHLDDPQTDGEDEVDNIMSKFAPQASIELKNSSYKRHSLSPYTSTGDTTEDNVLAKSLPTTLPSYSNYRDEDELRNPFQLQNKQSNNVRRRPQYNVSDQSYLSSNISYDEFPVIEETLVQRENTNVRSTGENKVKSTWKYLLLLSICVAVIYQYFNYYETESDEYNEVKFVHDLRHLEDKYRISGSSILQVETGILTISQNKDTGSFIFLGDSKSNNFNRNVFNDFINDVAITAVKYLRNESRVAQHLIIDSSTLDLENHHDFLNKYRDEVDRNGVMLVKELDRVPSSLAMAFHYYCDEYSPFVNNSAIFFTLDLANCSNGSGSKSIHSDVENCLKNKWRDGVPPANIGPLLSRVVNVIVDLRQT